MSIKTISAEETRLAAQVSELRNALFAMLQQYPEAPGSYTHAGALARKVMRETDPINAAPRAVLTQPADQPGDFYVMLDGDQSAAHATTIHEARAEARRIFMDEPIPCGVSIADGEGNTIEDLGFNCAFLQQRGYRVHASDWTGTDRMPGRSYFVILPDQDRLPDDTATELDGWLAASAHFTAPIAPVYTWRRTPAGALVMSNAEGADVANVYAVPSGKIVADPWGRERRHFEGPTAEADARAHVEAMFRR